MSILVSVIFVALLILASAIFSGLNVALMSLDPSELRRQIKLGNKTAALVLPYRLNIHLTLASIVFSNVGVISATSLVMDQHLSGLLAGLFSTLLIVIFGEVLPQALFSKDALLWAGRFGWLLRLVTFVTYPISKPLQILFDRIIGRDATSRLYGREELGMLITEHAGSTRSELDEDEIEILKSVLQLSEKRVRTIMTPIEKAYWLTSDTLLSEDLIDDIVSTGYSRVPIFNPEMTYCEGILLVKDMINNYRDSAHLAVSDLSLHAVKPVGSRTALDTLFRRITTSQTHMLPVENSGAIVGIVTIEDLIEEIIGHEIQDETDRKKNRV